MRLFVRRVIVAVCLAFGALAGAAAAQVPGADPQFLEAKRLFDGLDYENAVRALDQAIAVLQARTPQDLIVRDLLASAYEMRGRSKFGLGDQAGARADFTALLKVNPAYVLTGDVSPRVVALFETTAKETVTTVNLSVAPATARVDIDGVLVTARGVVPVAIGDHTITVDQLAYRRVQQPFSAEAGKALDLSFELERVASLLNIVTVPFDVDVTIDGIKKGKTRVGPPPAALLEAFTRAGGTATDASAVMVVSDLPPGPHVVEFTRDCYVRVERRVTIDKPDDYTVGPVPLDRAVAALSVRANEQGAQVSIDGQARGVAPFVMTDLCEGEHLVELRSPTGRYVKRIQARTGDRIAVEGTIKPALAIVSVSGQPQGGADLRVAVERAFDPSQGTTLFAPPADAAAQALRANQLTDGWLAYDGNKRPLGSADLAQPLRRDAATKLAATFGAQGVAAVTLVERNRVVLSLLAAGSSEPDVLAVSLDNSESIASAIGQLDRLPAFFKPSIGLTAIDIADRPGALVLRVDANGPAAKAGIKAGDTVTKANGQTLSDAVALNTLLSARGSGDAFPLEVKDAAGAVKQADLKVVMTPRVIGVADQTMLANRMLLALRAKLAGAKDANEESVLRLNLAAALARVEAWSDARTELQRVKLADGPGVSNGTVQYLLGLCAERLGSRAEAEAAFKTAAASEALLTEDGPAVKELAEARLLELQRPR